MNKRRDEITKDFNEMCEEKSTEYDVVTQKFFLAIIDFCVKEVEKRVNEIKARIKLDKETFKACSRDIKGHNRALMIIDEVMNGK